MFGIRAAQHQAGLTQGVVMIDLFYLHDRQGVVARVVQGDLFTVAGQGAFLDRQGDRNGEQGAITGAHFGQDAFVVGLFHETVQRRKGAGRQQLQVAHSTR